MNLFYLLIFLLTPQLFRQDNLLDLFDDDSEKSEYVESSFKGTRVVNAQSLEIHKPKILQFMIQDRFGSIENGFYDLFGMDYATIRFDFHYGLTDRISFGIGRSSLDKIYDVFLKSKLIRQTSGAKPFPFSVLLYSDIGIDTKRKSETNAAVKDNFSIEKILRLELDLIKKLIPTTISI